MSLTTTMIHIQRTIESIFNIPAHQRHPGNMSSQISTLYAQHEKLRRARDIMNNMLPRPLSTVPQIETNVHELLAKIESEISTRRRRVEQVWLSCGDPANHSNSPQWVINSQEALEKEIAKLVTDWTTVAQAKAVMLERKMEDAGLVMLTLGAKAE